MFSSATILKPDVPPAGHTFTFDGVHARMILAVGGIAAGAGLVAWLFFLT